MHAVGPVTVIARLLVALLFVSLVVEQAPHTVHHLFEIEHVDSDCPLATAGDRLPGLGADVVGLDHGLAWEPTESHPAPARLLDILARGSLARAPPLLASSLASLSSPRS